MKMDLLKSQKIKFGFLALAVLSSNVVHAQSVEEFYKSFKTSNYQQALSTLEAIQFTEDKISTKYYLEGLTQARLQEFDKAILALEKAAQLKNDAPDLYYELGQAYYASNDIKKARMAFSQSAKLNFNRANSLYYVGHISQTLEEYKEAKKAYMAIIKNRKSDEKVLQIARFQLAETLLSMARETKAVEKITDRYVIPLLRQAYDTDRTTVVASEIQLRIQELLNEFKLDPNTMANGRKINPDRYVLTLAQKIKFDTNVTLANDQSTVTQSKKESYIFETEGYGKRDFVFKKRIIISPDLRVVYTQYSDSKNATVYQNNSYLFTYALRNRFEHTLWQKPASFLFDIERNYTARDKSQEKKRTKYATSQSFMFGEKFRFFSAGETTIKYKFKDYAAYLETLNNKTTSLSLDQTIFTKNQHLMIVLFSADFIDNYNATNNSTDSYLFRLDYLIPEFMPQYTLGFALSSTFLDTKEQTDTRGMEKTLAASVDITRDISKNLKVNFNYELTQNTSKSETYEYKKSIFLTEIKYQF
ncbi:MAG: tetratricopeptide repeat protein [Bacteriovoracaceae bacterium]|nr:tetratricopeptide repeat protein [Bacteriovoracaceae bacterium]